MIDAREVEGKGFYYMGCELLLIGQRMDSIQIYKYECGYDVHRNKWDE